MTTPAPEVPGYTVSRPLSENGNRWAAVHTESGRQVMISLATVTPGRQLSSIRPVDHIQRALRIIQRGRKYLIIITDLLSGCDIDTLLSLRGPLTAGEVVTLVSTLAGALDSLHEQGQHHGLVDPDHVFVEPNGRPWLGAALSSVDSNADTDIRQLAAVGWCALHDEQITDLWRVPEEGSLQDPLSELFVDVLTGALGTMTAHEFAQATWECAQASPIDMSTWKAQKRTTSTGAPQHVGDGNSSMTLSGAQSVTSPAVPSSASPHSVLNVPQVDRDFSQQPQTPDHVSMPQTIPSANPLPDESTQPLDEGIGLREQARMSYSAHPDLAPENTTALPEKVESESLAEPPTVVRQDFLPVAEVKVPPKPQPIRDVETHLDRPLPQLHTAAGAGLPDAPSFDSRVRSVGAPVSPPSGRQRDDHRLDDADDRRRVHPAIPLAVALIVLAVLTAAVWLGDVDKPLLDKLKRDEASPELTVAANATSTERENKVSKVEITSTQREMLRGADTADALRTLIQIRGQALSALDSDAMKLVNVDGSQAAESDAKEIARLSGEVQLLEGLSFKVSNVVDKMTGDKTASVTATIQMSAYRQILLSGETVQIKPGDPRRLVFHLTRVEDDRWAIEKITEPETP